MIEDCVLGIDASLTGVRAHVCSSRFVRWTAAHLHRRSLTVGDVKCEGFQICAFFTLLSIFFTPLWTSTPIVASSSSNHNHKHVHARKSFCTHMFKFHRPRSHPRVDGWPIESGRRFYFKKHMKRLKKTSFRCKMSGGHWTPCFSLVWIAQ